MAVTAKRNNMRLLAIVLGEEVSKVRNQETTELLDYGFNLYQVELLQSKDEKIDTLSFDKANKNSANIYVKEDVTILGKKSDMRIDYDREIKLNNVTLPLKSGTIVGKVFYKYNNKIVKEEDLIVKEDIKKENYFIFILEKLRDVLVGDIL